MIYLILAIISSALIAVFMRLSESRRESRAGIFIFNYAACIILSLIFMGSGGSDMTSDGIPTALGLGAVTGVLYLVTFVIFQKSIKENGVVLASVFMKLGLIVPIIMAIFLFKEAPGVFKIIGIIISVCAIIVFNFDKQGMKARGNILFLILLLVLSGFADSMVNIFDEYGNPDLSDSFLLFTYCMAIICSFILLLVYRERLGKWDILFGILVGVPNYFSARFLLLALREVTAVVSYTAYSVATLIIIGVVGILLFRESFSRQKLIGFILVIAALVLLQQ